MCNLTQYIFFSFYNLGTMVSVWTITEMVTLAPINVVAVYGRNGKLSQHREIHPKSKTWIQINVWGQMEENTIVMTQESYGICKKTYIFSTFCFVLLV